MFDQLFKKPRVLARYRDGPLAEERRRYLVHCAEQRMARSTLREIAIYTLGVAKALRLAERPGEFITSGEIKAAADCWVRRRSPQRSLPTVSTAWRLFTRFATRWLSFLGRLQPVITASQRYLGQVTAFADHMRQERGLSPRTIEICCRTACEFLAHLSEAGLRLDTLTIPQVDDIVARQIREGGYARVTVRGYVSRLRAFFRYAEACAWCCQGLAVALVAPRLFRDESLPSGPSWEDVRRLHAPELVEWCGQVRLVPFKKAPRALVTYLEKAEMDALLAAPDLTTAQGRRDHALLLFLYNSGARADEAAHVLIGDLQLGLKPECDPSAVLIRGKGNKLRRCPLWARTVNELVVLAQGRAEKEHVFLNCRGARLTRFGIHTMVERHAARVAEKMPSVATKRVSPHTIRHTTATHLLRAGVDINTIRAWLGHVSLVTTNVYAEVDLEMKAKALASCEVEEEGHAQKPYREDKGLMEFLRNL